MRKPSYLSPSALKLWLEDPSAYYVKYLCEKKLPNQAQTPAMAVGSAADAYIKSFLYGALFGTGSNEKFTFRALFDKQVEEQNRDDALKFGAHVFEIYKTSGMLGLLIKELEQAQTTPRFEDTLEGVIDGVNVLGKPDLYFTTKKGTRVILDWKVNGYLGTGNTSPKPGYINVWPANKAHKDCFCQDVGGVAVNIAMTMEKVDKDWATQITTYALLLELTPEDDYIGAIDQFCGTGKVDILGQPELRIALHRLRVAKEFQTSVLQSYKDLWNAIENNHIFKELPLMESRAKCAELDDFANSFDLADPKEQAFLKLVRK